MATPHQSKRHYAPSMFRGRQNRLALS